MKVNIQELEARNRRLFEAAGVPAEDARIMTDVLLQTEMRGVFTHGFFRVPYYLNCIRSGGIKTNGEISVVQDAPSLAVVDGNDNLGMVISKKAMELAIEKAKNTGIGIVNVRGSHHFGAAGYYTNMCVDQGMMGMAMSNGDILVAATGSRVKSIGNNPFAFAAPAGKYNRVVYDIAMSHTSDKKVVKMAKDGQKLPDGWLIDKNGVPTNDPNEYEKGGTLMPFGGYKGYGMAMMVELLAAVLSGAAMTTNVHAWNRNPEQGGNVGHFFMALDISRITDPERFIRDTEEMIEGIKNSEKAVGVQEIFFPGEIENRKLQAALESGTVEVDDATMEAFAKEEAYYGL